MNVRQEFGQWFYWQCRGGQKVLVQLFSQPWHARQAAPDKIGLVWQPFLVREEDSQRRFVGIDLFTFLAGANS